jgi:hypothetical protein
MNSWEGSFIHTLRLEYISDDENSRMSTEFKEHMDDVLAPLEATLASKVTRLDEHHALSVRQHEKLIKETHDCLAEASEKFKLALEQQVHEMTMHTNRKEEMAERIKTLATQARKEFRNVCFASSLEASPVEASALEAAGGPNRVALVISSEERATAREEKNARKTATEYLLQESHTDLKKRQAKWNEERSELREKIKSLEDEREKLMDQISYVGTKNYQRKLERNKEIAEARKLVEEHAELRRIAEHNQDIGERAKKMLADMVERKGLQENEDKEALQRGDLLLQSLRDMLKGARQARDAALLENQNLKRKREGSTSPPPPQITLLTRPKGMQMDQQPTSSPARAEAPSPARVESPLAKQPSTKRSRNRKDR